MRVGAADVGLVQGFAAEIWASDGTAAGTRLIGTRNMNAHAVFQGRFYFGSYEPDFHEFLWVTDGTEAGTVPVFDQACQPIPYPRRFAVLDDHLLFSLMDGSLWESDGTPAGTFRLLPDTHPGFSMGDELIRAGSHAFFPGFSPETGAELWAVEEAAP